MKEQTTKAQVQEKSSACPHQWEKEVVNGRKVFRCVLCGCVISDND